MNKILILGGTNFIGRNLVESLLQIDTFDLTLFNRGKTNPTLFPDVKKIKGDRNTSDINSILDIGWDYIIDLSCYYPKPLSNILRQLSPSLKRYLFISTCSVYDNDKNKSILKNENSAILDCGEEDSTETTTASYGNRKAQCEREIIQSGINYVILRPALVYGKYDNTDRFYYWLYQIKKEHELLIPNFGKNVFSVTYVQDLVRTIIKTLNTDINSDTYNVTTNPQLSISDLIDTTSKILKIKPKSNNVDPDFLRNNNVSEWVDLPLWIDSDYFTFDNEKALRGLGLEVTNFETSVIQTIDYYNEIGWKIPAYGISDESKNTLITKLNNN